MEENGGTGSVRIESLFHKTGSILEALVGMVWFRRGCGEVGSK